MPAHARPEAELSDRQERLPTGWAPTRGIPPSAGGPRSTEKPSYASGTAASSSRGRMSPRQPASPRASGSGTPGSAKRTSGFSSKRDVMDEQRTARHNHRNFKTEAERSFQRPDNHAPPVDEYGRPVRRLYNGRIKKRVELKVEGESDGVMYQENGEELTHANAYALDEIYPEKFDGSAGLASKNIFKQHARGRMAEYFPEKVVQAYVAGEVDELIYGEPIAGLGDPGLREIPMLKPDSFMSAAGLTSKELKRNVLKEKLDDSTCPEPHPYVSDRADEVMYGRRTSVNTSRRSQISELPVKGSAEFGAAAGMGSDKTAEAGAEPLDLKLQHRIQHVTPPYLGGEADEVIYGRQMGGSRSELNEISDLLPKKFSGSAGLTSNEVIKSNPDLDHYICEQPPGSSNKIELRRGGEMAERLGAVSGEAGDPLVVVSSYPEQFDLTDGPDRTAGLTSSDFVTKGGSAEQMIFRINPQSGLTTGGEAAQAIYGNTGDTDINSFVHKGSFEISSIYPAKFNGCAGSSSRDLFKNSPEAGHRHLFSENLKGIPIGRPGHGTDAGPKRAEGAAGLNSRQLFKGHSLDAMGDTPREGAKGADGEAPAHLRDEEADIVLYGGETPDSELRKVGGISDKNPPAFDGAAGLTSRQVYQIHGEQLKGSNFDDDNPALGQARWAGEMESVLYNRVPTEHEVHKLKPRAYYEAAGLTSRVAQQASSTTNLDEPGRGQKKLPDTAPAASNPNVHPTTDLSTFAPEAYSGSAGLTSRDQHSAEAEEAMEFKGVKVDPSSAGGEAAAVVFGKEDPEAASGERDTGGAAGLTSKQARQQMKRSDAKTFTSGTMRDPGGSEAHDTLYGKDAESVAYDGNLEARIHEIPEIFPEKYTGAAGLPTKDVFRQQARPFMFGEKTSDGKEYGAKHISSLDAAPSASQLNSAFMRSSHWFEAQDGDEDAPSEEALQQAFHAQQQARDARDAAQFQQFSSYGSQSVTQGDAEGGDWARGEGGGGGGGGGEGYAAEQREAALKQRDYYYRMFIEEQQQAAAWRRHQQEQQEQQQQGSQQQQQQQADQSPADRASPNQRTRSSPSAWQPSVPTGGADSDRSSRPHSQRSGPALFEKGSFAHRKLDAVSGRDEGGPISGRSSGRGGSAFGKYADFASRMHTADSQRSQRSQRSYRG